MIEPYLCPTCEKGSLSAQRKDYAVKLSEDRQFIVKQVHMDICDFCGESALGHEGAEQIKVAIDEFNKSLILT